MAQTFGTGDYAVYVEWKNGSETTIYRYKDEGTRDKKLKAFKSSGRVLKATPASY